MIEPRTFRNTLGRFATGVSIVTVLQEQVVRGLTVNAFMSLSLEPPLIAVCIDKLARTHELMKRSRHFGVSVLGVEQEDLSRLFAGTGPPAGDVKFEKLAGAQVVAGALAQLACRVRDMVETGDHTLFVGEVEALNYRDGRPLVFFSGRYSTLNDLNER